MTLDPAFDSSFAAPPGALAANVDRERAIDVLRAGFAEGRLTKREHDDRVARVYAARTYGELGALVADLPTGPLGGPARYPDTAYPNPVYPGPVYPAAVYQRRPVSSTAVASLVCGITVFFTMGLTAIPAIVLGHSARRELRATGQRGEGMALTGVALGWVGIAMMAIAVAGLIAISVVAHNVHQVHEVIITPAPGYPDGPIIQPDSPVFGG